MTDICPPAQSCAGSTLRHQAGAGAGRQRRAFVRGQSHLGFTGSHLGLRCCCSGNTSDRGAAPPKWHTRRCSGRGLPNEDTLAPWRSHGDVSRGCRFVPSFRMKTLPHNYRHPSPKLWGTSPGSTSRTFVLHPCSTDLVSCRQ